MPTLLIVIAHAAILALAYLLYRHTTAQSPNNPRHIHRTLRQRTYGARATVRNLTGD
jgi:hypothetical protein